MSSNVTSHPQTAASLRAMTRHQLAKAYRSLQQRLHGAGHCDSTDALLAIEPSTLIDNYLNLQALVAQRTRQAASLRSGESRYTRPPRRANGGAQ